MAASGSGPDNVLNCPECSVSVTEATLQQPIHSPTPVLQLPTAHPALSELYILLLLPARHAVCDSLF